MDQNYDLIDLLRALNEESAEYLIVGGYALAVHGRVCATRDVDVFVGMEADNAAKVWRALATFGAPLKGLRVEEPRGSHRYESTYGGLPVHYIGREDLIRNKEAANRPQDRLDVAYLREPPDA